MRHRIELRAGFRWFNRSVDLALALALTWMLAL